VRFNTEVEVQEFVPIDAPTIHIGPCGELHSADPSDPLAPKRIRYQHAPDVRHAAVVNFMKFHRRDDFDGVCEDEIEESSLGISGWAFAHVPDLISADIGESMTLGGSASGNCMSIDPEPRNSATQDTVDAMRRSRRRRMALDSLGVQTVQLLDAIGALDDVVEKIESSILPVTTDDDEGDILGVDSWIDSEIEITLDSGCCEHVMDLGDAPGYGAFLTQSDGSRRKQNFIVGNGQKVPNEGQLVLNLESDGDEGRKIKSTFQVAEVTRPLMSVSRVCDQGLTCNFTDTHALVLDKAGKIVVKFERRGGLYIARMRLKPPEGFVGQVPR